MLKRTWEGSGAEEPWCCEEAGSDISAAWFTTPADPPRPRVHSFSTLTLNRVKESACHPRPLESLTVRPSLLPFMISEGSRREVNHLYVDPARTVGAISDNLPFPFVTQRYPAHTIATRWRKRRLHWREPLRCSYKPPPLGGTWDPAALVSTLTVGNLQKEGQRKRREEQRFD